MKIQFISRPKEYFKSLNINSNELHAFSTSTLEQYIKNILFADKKMNIVLFKDIEKILYPKWNNTIEVIRMTSILRDIIEKMDISFEERTSYLKDIDNILEAIRYLSELGVKEINNLLAKQDVIFSCLYSYQRLLKEGEKLDRKKGKKILNRYINNIMFTKEEYLCLNLKNKIWVTISKKSLEIACKIRNFFNIGF